MKALKFTVLLLLAIGLMACLPAHAQNVAYNRVTMAGVNATNFVATATTNTTVAITIPALRSQFVAIQPTFNLDGAGTTAVVFKFDHSLDGSSWDPLISTYNISVTPSGTNVVTAVGTFQQKAVGYLRLSYIANPNSANITNLVIKYATKDGI